MHPVIIIGTFRSLWTWLWGRCHVPPNAFLVITITVVIIIAQQSGILTDKHTAVGVVGDREEMRRHLGTAFTAVLADDVRGVDRQATVRVDDDAEKTRVRLSQPADRCPVFTSKSIGSVYCLHTAILSIFCTVCSGSSAVKRLTWDV